jgi:hypothetical protein
MMGPGPPPKGGSKNASQRALNTAGQGSSYAGSTAMSSEPPSSPTNVTEGSRISGEGWNRKRYQREDEDLWGHDIPGPGQRIMDAIARAGSSAGRLLEGRLSRSGPLKEEENSSSYYKAKNPPVNDLHPPVVSTAPSNRNETRWMLQPPPAAKIMEGKERINRSRASSNGSSRRGGDEIPLSRQVTERLVDARLQRGETPYSEMRPISSRTHTRSPVHMPGLSKGLSREGSRSPSIESSGSSDAVSRRKRKPPPISITPSGRSSRDTIEHIPIPSSSVNEVKAETKEQTMRPMLSTIVSSSVTVPQLEGEDGALQPSSNSAMNSRTSSPSHRLSPNANAMPVTIPKLEARIPVTSTSKISRSASMENEEPSS